jgi:predicted nucleotide-binding protein
MESHIAYRTMTYQPLSPVEALPLLEKQSEKAKRLLRGQRSSVTWIQALSWRNTTLEILLRIYRPEHRNTQLFLQAKNFIPKNSSYPGYFFLEGSHNLLLGFIEQLEMGIVPEMEKTQIINRKILIINGQNDDFRGEIVSFLQSLDLEPILLDKQEDAKTLLDKFSCYSDECCFALVILTGYDIAKPVSRKKLEPKNYGNAKKSEMARYRIEQERLEQKRRRARENEFFDLGFFLGRMGPSKVRVLSEEIFERPSDVDGVLYIPLDERWKDRLITELQESGIELDI